MEYEVHIIDGITMLDPQSEQPTPDQSLTSLMDEFDKFLVDELDKLERARLLEQAKENDEDA